LHANLFRGICTTVYTRLLAALFLPGIWPVFCLRLIRATYPEGQSFSHELSPTFSHPVEPQMPFGNRRK